jgi:hypothetical protein
MLIGLVFDLTSILRAQMGAATSMTVCFGAARYELGPAVVTALKGYLPPP